MSVYVIIMLVFFGIKLPIAIYLIGAIALLGSYFFGREPMRKVAKVLLVAVWMCFGALAVGSIANAQDAPVVTIAGGRVAGFTKNDVNVFLGIPYAAPPLGDLRWMPPVPPKPWRSTLSAVKFANRCAQGPYLGTFASPSEEEDCLYLNVYASKKPNAAGHKKPVMVWIFGGGLVVGEADDYDGSKLAADGDTVVVTINYRLGVLGWLAHPALDKEGHPFANYGMLDQQFALKWVKQNIEAFGGDPDNVTIFGQSAGATSVVPHIISPLSAGLFQHAIAQSGGAAVIKYPLFQAGGRVGSATPLDAAEEAGKKFAVAAGCPDQGTACLRKLSVKQILATQEPYLVSETIIDGTIIPTTYKEALSSGHVNRVTFVNGNTRDEWRWAYGFFENLTGKPITSGGYPAALKGFFGDDLAEKVLPEYPLSDYSSPSLAIAAATTDAVWACSARKISSWLSGVMPTYAFEFNDETAPSYLEPTTFPLGAGHTMDIQYVLPLYHGNRGIVRELNPLQQKLSDKMVELWTHVSMAKDGALWAKYDPKLDNFLSLTLPEPEMTTGAFGKFHKCDFWESTGIY
jgi:para-nitrobenzyl esterase